MKKKSSIIDAHHHWMPQEHYDNPERYVHPGEEVVHESDGFHVQRGGVKLFSASSITPRINEQIKTMDRAGVDKAVLHIGVWFDWIDIKTARFINDTMAEIAAQYPDRIIPLAHVPPLEPEGQNELRRTVLELGFKGVGVTSHIRGTLLDDSRFAPFYRAVSDLNIPIFVHPAAEISLPQPHGMEQFDLSRNLGRAFDTTINIARLILSGTFDHFPNIRFVFSHLGGAFFALKNRLKSARLDRDPAHLLEKCHDRIFVDTAPPFWSPEEIRFAVKMMGEKQILLGSDFPRFARLESAVMTVQNAHINTRVKKKLLGGNASDLFH
ncbi:MAG: amidohydrolase family protein [Deltaproteobacteria bacterium]|nr:amidohydrolase family protein [Deltaproteobacteria bacterium]